MTPAPHSARRVLRAGILGLALVSAAMSGGCLILPRSPVVPPPGMVYTHFKAPLEVNQEDAPVATGEGNKLRQGESSTTTLILWPISSVISLAWGDASVHEAARDGGITKVHYADYEYTQVLAIWAEYKVVVHGE